MKDLWLTFGGKKQVMFEGYCDTNWVSQAHRHSISGYSFSYRISLISWSSKKQSIITLLSTKAEYIAETHVAKEGICLKSFVKEIIGQETGALTMMVDNQGEISLTKDNKFHARTKHINLWYHFVHEAVEEGRIQMKYILASKNIADIFTRALSKPKFTEFVGMLGLAIMKEC